MTHVAENQNIDSLDSNFWNVFFMRGWKSEVTGRPVLGAYQLMIIKTGLMAH